MSIGRTTSPIVTSMETSLRYQMMSLGGDSGLQATVRGTRNSLRTTFLWETTHGKHRPGRPSTTFVQILKRDVGTVNTAELVAYMTNRDCWDSRRATRLRPPYESVGRLSMVQSALTKRLSLICRITSEKSVLENSRTDTNILEETFAAS